MILLIDNYDSFTFNLYHFLGDLGARGARCGATTRSPSPKPWRMQPEAIVLSPGPCTPNEAGICLRPDRRRRRGADADAGRLPRPSGDRPGVRRQGGPRAGADARQGQRASTTAAPTSSPACPIPFGATRYHRLIVDRDDLPDVLVATAWTDGRPGHGHAPPRRCRSAACSSTRRASPSEHGHDLLRISSPSRAAPTRPARAA